MNMNNKHRSMEQNSITKNQILQWINNTLEVRIYFYVFVVQLDQNISIRQWNFVLHAIESFLSEFHT